MRIAVVMSGFPRRSETFALNELLALHDAGVLAAVFATKPGDGSSHPGLERLDGVVHTLASGTPTEQAGEIADRLTGRRISGIHAYFAHIPAEVASIAAATLGCRWGFSTHALDARKIPPHELAARARAAACVVACNRDVAAEIEATGTRVTLIPHGVDIARFAETTPPVGGDALRVLAVGRLVEKKGFRFLIDAAALAGSPLDVRIVGDGPLRDDLEAQVAACGLGGRVAFHGPMTHADLPAAYAGADVVAVPSVVNAAGDRDGLPNVVLEAMASGRPVIASDVGAVTAAVVDGVSGLVVPPGDGRALADGLDRLARDPALRVRLAAGGRMRAERDYGLAACTSRFVTYLEGIYG